MLGMRFVVSHRARVGVRAMGVALAALVFTSSVATAQEAPAPSPTTTTTTVPIEDPAPPTTEVPAPPTTEVLAPPTTEVPAPPTTEVPAPPTTEVPAPPTTEVPAPPTTEDPTADPAPEPNSDTTPCVVSIAADSSSTGPDVECIESRLVILGFFASTPDEIWDSDTKAAVSDFQTAVGIVPSGDADPFTLTEMEIWDGAPAAFPCSVKSRVHSGSSGFKVRCLESRLITMGFSSVNGPDGIWDDTTFRAVRLFERLNGLPNDGEADPYTLDRLGIWGGDKPAFPCTIQKALDSDSRGRGVRCLELRLGELGLFSSVPDSVWDSETRAGVRSFQKSRALIGTGNADPYTLTKMRIWSGNKAAFPCTVGHTVSSDSRGMGVACVESRLRNLGYSLDGPDRVFNKSTGAAIKAYERDKGFISDRAADPYTLQKMGIWRGPRVPFPCKVASQVNSNSKGRKVACLEMKLRQRGYSLNGPNRSFDSTTGDAIRQFERSRGLIADRTADPYTLHKLRIWSGSTPAFPCNVKGGVSKNSTGKRVKCLESRLRDLGYSLNGPNRTVDQTTTNAIRAYQSSRGLTVDGIAGPYTMVSLGIWNGPPPAEILPKNSGTGRRVVYSKSRMRLWTVEADGRVSKTHLVSGNRQFNNPFPGTYNVYSKSIRTCAVDASHICWGYMVRFAKGPNGGNIGFHEIPTNLETGQKLQTVSQLGQALSAGCVRQDPNDAVYIWNWAPVGTKVVVLG